jgi:hypothetical protein
MIQSPIVSQHSGATRIRLTSILHMQNFAHVFLFSNSLDTCSGYTPKATKVLKVAALGTADKNKEKG